MLNDVNVPGFSSALGWISRWAVRPVRALVLAMSWIPLVACRWRWFPNPLGWQVVWQEKGLGSKEMWNPTSTFNHVLVSGAGQLEKSLSNFKDHTFHPSKVTQKNAPIQDIFSVRTNRVNSLDLKLGWLGSTPKFALSHLIGEWITPGMSWAI